MADSVQVRTLRRIEDPQAGGVRIAANVVITLPAQIAERLIDEGKAERLNNSRKDAESR